MLFVHKAQNLWYNFLVMTVVNGKFEWDSEKDEINKSKHGISPATRSCAAGDFCFVGANEV